MSKKQNSKLWGGRFKKKPDAEFEIFSESFRWDKRLAIYDLRIDVAHVKALRKAAVLSVSEESKLLKALRVLLRRAELGSLSLNPQSEDVHSAIQEELAKSAGALANKLHTGRSRNDLVSQSSRLYCKEKAQALHDRVRSFQKAVVIKADEYKNLLLPGMTHMQNAQVLSMAHILLSYTEMLERSSELLKHSISMADVCVLGSGALAGTVYSLDQKLIARELGLSRVGNNSYDVSGDRDYILNLLWSISFLGTHLSRISEDLMLYQTKGFSVVDIDQPFCTGSSMMPQKKNADFIELTRGASGFFNGRMLALLTTLKGLPTSYNRDLQWDKSGLFDSVETMEQILSIMTRVFKTLGYYPSACQELLRDETLYATDMADYLVMKGVAFKTAHEVVGQIVSFSESSQVSLSKIGLDIFKKFSNVIDGDVYDIFDAKHSVRMKKTQGSTHPDKVSSQINAWKNKLKNF